MKRMIGFIAILGILTVAALMGCQQQEAAKPMAPATAPTSTPTGTAMTAPTATAPAK
jgi:hypothetical protein